MRERALVRTDKSFAYGATKLYVSTRSVCGAARSDVARKVIPRPVQRGTASVLWRIRVAVYRGTHCSRSLGGRARPRPCVVDEFLLVYTIIIIRIIAFSSSRVLYA